VLRLYQTENIVNKTSMENPYREQLTE